VPLTRFRREHECGFRTSRHRLEQHQSRSAQGSNRPSRLAVGKDQQAALEVDLGPSQSRYLVAPTAGKRPKLCDLDSFHVGALCLQRIERFPETRNLFERQEAVSPVVGLANGREIARVAWDQTSSRCKAENCGEISHDLARSSLSASNDDPRPRRCYLVTRRLTKSDIPHEPLDLARADVRNPLVTKERHDMMPKARNRIVLRPWLHRLALPKAALHEATLGLVKGYQRRNGHFPPPRLSLAGWVLSCRGGAKKHPSLPSGLIHRQRAKPTDCREPPRSGSAPAICTVTDYESLRPALFHAQAKPGETGVPNVKARRPRSRRINNSLRQQNSIPLTHNPLLEEQPERSNGVHMVSTVDGNASARFRGLS